MGIYLSSPAITYGADPEGFFVRNGKVIGSERLLTEQGYATYLGRVVRDGVQFEFNPSAANSIDTLARNMQSMFMGLHTILQHNQGVSVSFDGMVEVTREELNSLSYRSRVLGCMPSHNFYGPRPITVDAVKYRKRSAGGHCHFGLPDHLKEYANRAVPLLDIFVGLPSVLLDRDPNARERRLNYGRAGEYRLPRYGVEYRTISNYWLRNGALMHFVFRMGHYALAVLNTSLRNKDKLEQELVDTVDIQSVVQAINDNDFGLAWRNFETVVPFIKAHPLDSVQPSVGIPVYNTDKFFRLAEIVENKGIAFYFPTEDIINSWVHGKFGTFSDFLDKAQ